MKSNIRDNRVRRIGVKEIFSMEVCSCEQVEAYMYGMGIPVLLTHPR